ncbi:MAG: glycosyltransferase [Burkholderiales bacterium]|nr:glycosyltransferase [Burkholderiales bacterium]
MRFFYADPGLLNNQSHHANSCRCICRELRALDLHVVILGCLGIDPGLRVELGATPFFDGYTYSTFSDGDPICGPLNAFKNWAWITANNLSRLMSIGAEDVLYLNSAQPPQFMGVIQWWKAIPESERPRVVVEFGTDPGVDVLRVDDAGDPTYQLRDYRVDPRPMLYRFAARHLAAEDRTRFHVATFDDVTSRVFGSVLDWPVHTLPLPQDQHLPVRSRKGTRPITIGVLGHQRPDKGFQLIPAIVRDLLASERNIRILVQNSVPSDMADTQDAIRHISDSDSRVSLDEGPVGAERWIDLLRESDLMLCPYDPIRYIASYSAVATDAVANAIPLVAPDGTSLARLIRKYGDCGVIYAQNSVESIVAATRYALAHFDVLADRADEAASRWASTMGAANTAHELLEITGRREAGLRASYRSGRLL